MNRDHFNYLIIKSDQCYFGFNLLDDVERGCIFSIIDSKSTDYVDGWMVSGSMPEWVGDHTDWMTHERKLLFKTLNESPPVSGLEDSDADDDKSSVSSRKSDDSDSFLVSCMKDRKICSLKKIEFTDTEDEFEFDDDKTKANCDWACEGRCIPGLSPVKCQYSGGCNKYVHHVCTIEWATENHVEVDSIAILCSDHHREYQTFIKSHSEKTSKSDFRNVKDIYTYSGHKNICGKVRSPQESHCKGPKLQRSKKFESCSSYDSKSTKITKTEKYNEDGFNGTSANSMANEYDDDDDSGAEDIFKSESFVQSLTQSLKERPAKRDSGFVDVYVIGPFRNEYSRESHWSVVYGNISEAWMLKANFVGAYVRTILKFSKFNPDDYLHTVSYHDINIRSQEFGALSIWKRQKGKKGVKTVNRLSFVFTIKTSEEGTGLDRIQKIMKKIAWAMKKRDLQPVGTALFKHLQVEEQHIFEYFNTQYHNNEKAIIQKMTDSIDAVFKNGFNVRMHSHLNQFMVDYDIIRVPRDNMGYSSWGDLSETELDLCFKNYTTTKNRSLPDWNIEEETY